MINTSLSIVYRRLLFFFSSRRRHTRLQGDWSSDVCSSDLGYLGGLASLGICLAYITAAQRSGQPAALFVPVTMLITAGFFAVAATPTFLFLRERAVPPPATENAWKRVRDTLRHARA